MRYLFASFPPEAPDDAIFSFHEVGDDGLEVRKIELLLDGRILYCSKDKSSDPDYYLSNFPIPNTEAAKETVEGIDPIDGDASVFFWLWRRVADNSVDSLPE
jgi:hypothetical protein